MTLLPTIMLPATAGPLLEGLVRRDHDVTRTSVRCTVEPCREYAERLRPWYNIRKGVALLFIVFLV